PAPSSASSGWTVMTIKSNFIVYSSASKIDISTKFDKRADDISGLCADQYLYFRGEPFGLWTSYAIEIIHHLSFSVNQIFVKIPYGLHIHLSVEAFVCQKFE